jgi:hypothetical protein
MQYIEYDLLLSIFQLFIFPQIRIFVQQYQWVTEPVNFSIDIVRAGCVNLVHAGRNAEDRIGILEDWYDGWKGWYAVAWWEVAKPSKMAAKLVISGGILPRSEES